ncbi:receptor-type tyrosine-protein phosphatase C isoform X3 [Oncorhynchus keta]|uniref:receptor-type tyrosine-protein phosphatase C isoform X3 n=1 Tax=Oncorhynchus keta TaxID=8018 RepID=UPI00227A4592|nr:receptor-type tyrosine-protein phosphatase C isoform X3 [Oncorhynchus keta]XP_052320204.1 receptor-type tyrosine-protein phosphatase C isoform X3 [Oncorhynchus keta]XP_052320206.1 receptor-type tyrosine-protein phosphatase C isoform X3 [Oncorhynchus keta]
MAGLYGLKILLLCTGLIELAICSAATIPPTGTVAITNKPPSIPITPLNSQTASISTTPPPINEQDKSSISTPSPTQSTKNANDSTGPLLPNTTTTTATTTISPSLSSLTPTSNILTQASSQATLSNATGDSSTSTSYPASTLNQTQTSNPASTHNQTQAFPTNTSTSQTQALPTNNSTSQTQALPTNNSTSPSLPTSTPPIHNQTSPASTLTSTTAIPTGSQTKPTPPKCTYTVTPVIYGFQIDLKASTSDTYNILYQDESGQHMTVDHQTVNSTIVVSLKPCRNYTFTKIQPECELQRNSTLRTEKMDDLEFSTNTKPGYLCYVTKWNISDAEWNSPVITWEKDNCFKLLEEHFCTNFTTNVAVPGGCSVNISKTIPITAEYSTVEHSPNLEYKNVLPVEIVWKNKPKNCGPKDLDIHYTCEGNSGSINLTDLEPFQKYNCSGKITHNSKVISTKSIDVEIKCEVDITKTSTNTNTSISLKWTNNSINCPRNTQLFHSCVSCRIETEVKDCYTTDELHYDFNQLQPFTNYICSIEPRYKDMSYDTLKKVSETILTAPGVPDEVGGKTSVTYTQNNAFTIICEELKPVQWKGKEKWYIATITGSETKPQNKKKCNFTFADLGYLTDYTVQIVTYNGKYKSKPIETHITTRYNDKAVIGFLVFLIILTSLALIFVLYKIYILQRKKSNNNDEQIELIQPSDEENLLNVEPIGSEVLLDAYKRKIADEGRLFLQEFQSIPRIFSRNTVREAKKSCNQPKNRYVDILPYDYNRVQLTSGNGETGCDYINASFIDGFKESKKYIAAQGPKEETVGDFWRMVWEQQSSIIVMVTRCEESSRNKCAQYWPSPEREVEIFEGFVVKLNREEHCPDYIIRHLSLTNKREKSAEREVTHIQFTSWPDHGVPGEPHLLLKLRRRVNAFKNLFSGPIVIHCSAGVGRTGTYMGIDAMMEGLEAEGRVDIYGYVVKLRRQRCLMVQVEAQYILIHQALIEHNQFGETEISLAELHPTLGTLKQRDPGNEPTLLEAEFQRLPRYKNWRTFNTGINEENKKKNRSSSVIPYDYNRVLVKLEDESSHDQDDDDDDDDSSDEEDEESTKYINATQIDGYWCQRSLIAAQGPLADTTGDFWQMVFQKKVNTIVMLSDLTEGDQEFCSAYWGEEKKTFRDIEVELKATDTLPAYTTRSLQIRHPKRKDSRQVKQYQFLKWAGRELPEKPQDLMDMIKNIKQTCGYGNSKAERILPVVVHCNDGSSRSGVFCALWNIMDSAETEKLVDVFQVAKALRKERQGMIHSLEQYQFLYDAVEGSFPIQNGEVKQPATAPAAAADSIQVVNETKAEQPASATTATQQGAEVVKEAVESTPLVAGKEAGAAADGNEDEAKEPGSPTEKTPLEGSSNGPAVTLEV